jgi:Tfp pilus assembly protein PilF
MIHSGIQLASCGVTGQSWRGEGHRATTPRTEGNAYLAEENFPEATAAFERARELDPKRPHVAERLAEVARRQHAASAPAPGVAAS